MIRTATLVLVLAAAFSGTLGYAIGQGACPLNVEPATDFNVTQFLGRWYEIERYAEKSEPSCRCTTADFSQDASGQLTLQNIMRISFGPQLTIDGSIEVATNGDALFRVTYNEPLFGVHTITFNVIDTDYKTYAVLYACRDENGYVKMETARVYSRSTALSADARKKVQEAVSKANLYSAPFITTSHSQC